MQCLSTPPISFSKATSNRFSSLTPSYCSEMGYGISAEQMFELEDISVAQQDLANVHFRFEEEEEYIFDYNSPSSMEDENPFLTPRTQTLLYMLEELAKETSTSPQNITPPNNTGKLKRSFGLDDLSPHMYYYDN